MFKVDQKTSGEQHIKSATTFDFFSLLQVQATYQPFVTSCTYMELKAGENSNFCNCERKKGHILGYCYKQQQLQ